MKILLFFLAVGTTVLIWSCKGPEVTADLSKLEAQFAMKKNPCYGRCPHYVLTIYKGRLAVYKGESNVDKFGVFARKLSRKEYRRIKKAFKKSNFFELQDHYPSKIQDIPKTRITYHGKDSSKTIVGDINRPKVILELDSLLVAIADAPGWTLREAPQIDAPAGVVPNEFIVEISNRFPIQDWILRFDRYGMEQVKALDDLGNRWLVRYNMSALPPKQMLERLQSDKEVISADFKKQEQSDK